MELAPTYRLQNFPIIPNLAEIESCITVYEITVPSISHASDPNSPDKALKSYVSRSLSDESSSFPSRHVLLM